ncbi:MAG: DUF2333 family protein [Halieaceae bacterium]|jgi:hypothetical protein|nr:DUF2333 family protein [Halieaceae bacterium]MBT5134294.1 DUF2333 family protein [Halieaceae bacterium]MBT5556907.1 DUF2333 family protein [Halieaceae bacterium]
MTLRARFSQALASIRGFLPEGDSLSLLRSKGGRRMVTGVFAAYALVVIGLGVYWSWPPAAFDVVENRADYLQSSQSLVTGSATTSALLEVTRLLLEKKGGYISNDVVPPGAFLDNMPSWEYGALIQSRDLARALREVLSRSQSQSQEDVDLTLAEPRINFQNSSWVLPSTESQYRDARRYLEAYLNRLPKQGEDGAQFYARADNLSFWLGMVEKRLGSLSQRLSASVGQRRANTDLAGDTAATQSTRETSEFIVKTPWHEVDNVYFESRGAAFALIHYLKAAEVDFAEVLAQKNAAVSLRQIIRELETTQQTVWSPVILNGSGFGIWANHSLVMASYLSRANAALIDLRELLAQG